jgi:catechol-2,3-dioxygenase
MVYCGIIQWALNKEKDRIIELGQEITLEQQVNGYDLFQFKDPEGNIIEVYTKLT